MLQRDEMAHSGAVNANELEEKLRLGGVVYEQAFTILRRQ